MNKIKTGKKIINKTIAWVIYLAMIMALLPASVEKASAADGESCIYVPLWSSGKVQIYNTTTHEVEPTTITVGTCPNSATKDDNGYLYVTNRSSNTISVIDTATADVKETIPAPSSPLGLAFDVTFDNLYISSSGGIYKYNMTAKTTELVVSDYTFYCTVTADKLYFVTMGGRYFKEYDLKSKAITKTIDLGGSLYLGNLSPDGRKFVVTDNGGSQGTFLIDIESGTFSKIPISSFYAEFSPDGKYIYVTGYNSDSNLYKYRASDLSPVSTLNLGTTSNYTFGIDPTGSRIYVLSYGSSKVCEVDAKKMTVYKTSDLAGQPYIAGGFMPSTYITRATSHTHDFTYVANGNTIKAYCTESELCEKCKYQGTASNLTKALTMSLIADNVPLSATEAYTGARFDNLDNFMAETFMDTPPLISYYKVENAGATTGGTAVSNATLRSEKGNYYAMATIEGKTVAAAFAVGKGNVTADDFIFTPPANTSYDGKAKTASVTAKEGKTTGNITIKYYDLTGAEVSAPKNSGTYTVKILVVSDEDYNPVTTPLTVGTFTITPSGIPEDPDTEDPLDPDDSEDPGDANDGDLSDPSVINRKYGTIDYSSRDHVIANIYDSSDYDANQNNAKALTGMYLDLTDECLVTSVLVSAYSTDGGKKWTAGSLNDFNKKLPKLLNKALRIRFTDNFNRSAKKPAEGADIYAVADIAARQKLGSKLKANYFTCRDDYGVTNGQWALYAGNTEASMADFEIGIADAKGKKIGENGYGLWPGVSEGMTKLEEYGGVWVSDLPSNGKTGKETYFYRLKPYIDDDGTIYPASKTSKIKILTVIAAPKIKIDYKKEIIKLKKDMNIYFGDELTKGKSSEKVSFLKLPEERTKYSDFENKMLVKVGASSDEVRYGIDISIYISGADGKGSGSSSGGKNTIYIWQTATEKKPVSIPQKIEVAMRGAAPADAGSVIKLNNGKAKLNKNYEVFDEEKNKWVTSIPVKGTEDAEYKVRLKATAKGGKESDTTFAAGVPKLLKLEYGVISEAKNISGFVNAVLTDIE